MEKVYQVGFAQNPRPVDPVFSEMPDALHKIQEWGVRYPDSVLAIWDITDVDTTHVVYLLFQGVLYQHT